MNKLFRKCLLPITLVFCMVASIFTAIPSFAIGANGEYEDNDKNIATITKLSDDTYGLSLFFNKHYNYTTAGIVNGSNQSSDKNILNGVVKNLLIGAVSAYNQANISDQITAPALGIQAKFEDVNYKITELTVSSAKDIYVSDMLFRMLLPSDGYVNLKKVDMSEMNISNSTNPNTATAQNILGQLGSNTGLFFGNTITYYTASGVTASTTTYYNKLEQVVLPKTIKSMGRTVLRNLPLLKEVNVPEGVEIISHYTAINSPNVERFTLPASLLQYGMSEVGVSYGNWTAGNAKLDKWKISCTKLDLASKKRLISDIISSKPVYLDFSGSDVTMSEIKQILNATGSTIKYLNILNCPAIEFYSDEGKALNSDLVSLQEKGAEVLMPNLSDYENKILIKVNSNNILFGSTKGTVTVSPEELVGKEITVSAIPNANYELGEWQLVAQDGTVTTVLAGSPNAKGEYFYSFTTDKSVTVTANFRIKNLPLPTGSGYRVENGKLAFVLANIVQDSDISLYSQILLRKANDENSGAKYTENDIVSIEISTAAGKKLQKAFRDIFLEEYLAALKNNLQKVDLKNAAFQSNLLPAFMFSNFKKLDTVVLPEGLTNIGTQALEYTKLLKNIVLPETVTVIGQRAFEYSGIVNITFPVGLKTVQPCAFRYCEDFKGTEVINSSETTRSYNVVSYPDGVDCIGDNAHVIYSLTTVYDCGPRQMYSSSQVSGVSYHGRGSAALFSHLLSAPSWKSSYFDLRNSGLTESQLSLIPFSSPSGSDKEERTCFFDIRGCEMDWTTSRGSKLLQKIKRFNEENPHARVLYDEEGKPRDNSYTVISADVTMNPGESLEAAMTRWANAKGATGAAVAPLVATVTDLTIKTQANASLSTADFTYISSKIGQSLRKVDLLDAKCMNDTVPDNAFIGLANLRSVIFPEDLKIIGASAFFGTDLLSVSFPQTLLEIRDKAFDSCFSLEGDCVLPNGLKVLGSSVFTAAGFRSIVYHGTADLQLSANFTNACESSVEFLDLRGCKNVTYQSLPTTWNALVEAHLDYCSIDYIYYTSRWIYQLQQRGVLITLSNQHQDFDDLNAILSKNPYGDMKTDYPQHSTDLVSYDYSNLALWNFDESGPKEITTVIKKDSDDFEYDYGSNNDNSYEDGEDQTSESGQKQTKVKRVVKVRKKIKTQSQPESQVNYTPYILLSVAALIIVAGITTFFIIRRKRKTSGK